MSVLLTVVVVPLGVAGGLAVALLSQTRTRALRWLVAMYVDFFRAFPPLVLLMFIAFGLPFTGLDLPAFAAVALAFLLNTSSYYGEIFRAGIESIPRGQFEAARPKRIATDFGAGGHGARVDDVELGRLVKRHRSQAPRLQRRPELRGVVLVELAAHRLERDRHRGQAFQSFTPRPQPTPPRPVPHDGQD